MSSSTNRCQPECRPDQIDLFLDQQLTDSEHSAFERHLEQCETCRRQLEQQAARDDVWRDARESLRSSGPATADIAPESTRGARRAALPTTSDDTGGAEDLQDRCRQALSLLAATDDPRMLGRFGPYEVAGVIGQGGMGVVFKGFDPSLNRFVAIKVLLPHLAESGTARKRFAREARAAAAVVHDNVVAIHGVAEWKGLPYLVMPYIRGESLQKRVERNGPLEVLEVLRIGRQVASGLAAAHAQGLVHRDIKPANILLEQGVERLRITDFGLARAVDDGSVTRTGLIAGTPQYMSPEQACGDPIDARSDLFSLGSVLYFLCAGRPPFRAETSFGILRKITDSEPRALQDQSPEMPDWLITLIGKLHAKLPADRFQTAGEVAELLEQCLSHSLQPRVQPLPAALRMQAPAPLPGSLCPPAIESHAPGLPRPDSTGNRKSLPAKSAGRRAATLVLLIVTASWAVWSLRPPAAPTASEGRQTSVGENPSTSATSSKVDRPPLWEDAVAERIGELLDEINAVEQSGLPLWNE